MRFRARGALARPPPTQSHSASCHDDPSLKRALETAMGCRCNERREAIVKAFVAISHGDAKTAFEAKRFVRDSLIEDAAEAARKLRTVAAVRLGIRRR